MHNKYWHQVFPGKGEGFHWIQFVYRVKSSISLEVEDGSA